MGRATPAPLYWHYISLDGKPLNLEPGKGVRESQTFLDSLPLAKGKLLAT